MAADRYRGVRALFNADLHTVCPEWAPRDHWTVIDAETIEHTPERASQTFRMGYEPTEQEMS